MRSIPGLPRPLGRLIRRCLREDPREWIQSVPDIRKNLEEIARGARAGGTDEAPSIAALPYNRVTVISLLLHLVFTLSGAIGLVYEVLWLRRLSLLFGATAPATVATLSSFFLGMGLGAAMIGRRSPRWRRPLRVFALLEVGVIVAAIGVEILLGSAQGILARLAWGEGSATTALAARMLLAVVMLAPPAALMGGTLPVLAQVVGARRGGLGVRAGGLYAVNTLGAAAGCLAVPLVLLPMLGAAGSILAAMAGSLVVSVAALALDAASPGTAPAPGTMAPIPRTGPGEAGALLLMGGAFFSGAVALGLEVLWTRMLALVHENSVQSFATVVAIHLLGTAAGTALGRDLLSRGRDAPALVAWGWIGAGALVMVAPNVFIRLSAGLEYVSGGGGLPAHEARVAGLAVAAFFPATVLAGLAFPALLQMAGERGGEAGPAVGRLLFANLVGCIVGPLTALALPALWGLGLWRAIAAFGALLWVAGDLLRAGARGRLLHPARLPALAAMAVLLGVLRPGSLPRARIDPGERIVSLREGAFGTVAVVESEGRRRLQLNNHYVLGGTTAGGEERFQGHLPLLLHRAPRSVAFLGLGTGISAGAALSHPVREVVAVELIPEVIEAARADFRGPNRGLMDDPRVRVVAEDARVVMQAFPGRFDVVVGDLVVPWRRGESSLYTLESFLAARRALAPGGLYCQWVPMFQLTPEEFGSIAATFLEVFPRATLWRGDFRAGEPAMALVGLTGDGMLDPEAITARARVLSEHPDPSNPYLVDPAGVWVFLVGALSHNLPPIQGSPLSRDGLPLVELRSAITHVSAGGAGAAFTGERLGSFVDALLRQDPAGTPLARLDPEHLMWRRAGARIWEASLLSLAGKDREADAVAFEALGTLPASIREAVLGG